MSPFQAESFQSVFLLVWSVIDEGWETKPLLEYYYQNETKMTFYVYIVYQRTFKNNEEHLETQTNVGWFNVYTIKDD